jgi:hypothetical protein
MRKETEDLVKSAFLDITGREAKKITDRSGKPPSEDNAYLYNAFLQQYEGLLEDAAKFKYVFFVYKKGQSWKAKFVPE